ncbi:MAG: peptidylprolyl isomerase [Clostridia bacterium]|nr:peptidylprolyl isomerase [Clostridia bacterium]MBQ2325930.1 peptidylprolyl isomerase [Clostridia bacterium]MBQ5812626.1 peptidylprolyl isomerase [Clostridia bacterium]
MKLDGMTDEQAVRIELYPKIAPKTVENFVELVNSGFYKNLKFHRCIRGFMVQGGCPLGTGTGGPGWKIVGEFASNGYANDIKHTRGVISMARTADPNSAGSQFFIMLDEAPHLDGDYAAFGKVTEGMEFIDNVMDNFEKGKQTSIKNIKVK